MKKLEIANYQPGLFASPHPMPQETTPKESATSFTMQEIDPPESPLKKYLDYRNLNQRSLKLLMITRIAQDRENWSTIMKVTWSSWISFNNLSRSYEYLRVSMIMNITRSERSSWMTIMNFYDLEGSRWSWSTIIITFSNRII